MIDDLLFVCVIIFLLFSPIKLDKDGKYPLLNAIPDTNFTCGHRSPGYYGDPHPLAQCQVYHMCMGGRHFAYLCPNHTLFHQDRLVCDHWYHVNCTDMERRYRINEELFSKKSSRTSNKTSTIFSQKNKHKSKCNGCLKYYYRDKQLCVPCVRPR
ncbi:U-scoloptoxin(01)-Er1a-like [Centruroides vittatus]|uniref:U-scoloptoxin(01)-Er1a-like n=1 Tax=Centruroides vittatus TaxID=120091 RepID=UPI00350F3641